MSHTRGSTLAYRLNQFLSVFLSLALVAAFTPTTVARADELEMAAIGMAGQADLQIALEGPITTDSTVLTVNASGLPAGARLYVSKFPKAQYEQSVADGGSLGYGAGEKLFDSNDASWFTFGEGKKQFYIGEDKLAAGDRVIAYVLNEWTIAAQSDPVAVKAADSPADPGKPTRADIIAGTSVSLASPHEDGVAAGKFMLSDTQATATVALHASVSFARLTIYAYPKAAAFDPDQPGKNISLGSLEVTESGAYTVAFGDNASKLTTDYNILAYLYYQVPPEENYDYQYKQSAGFEIVDEGGQTTEPYEYPKMSIVETALPTGATTMHISLSGDARLFKLAQDTANETSLNKRFTIHAMVIEYDASVESFDLDADGYGYTKLWDEEATDAFVNREIDLAEPLARGKKVRALCYWTQYEGDLTPTTVPRGIDYEGRDYEAIVVADDAPPVVGTPSVTVAPGITESTTSFNVTAKNLPDGALLFVQSFPESAEVEYNGAGFANLAVFSPRLGTAPKNGANAVNVAGNALAAGARIAAFVLSDGEVIARSEPVTVAVAAAASDGRVVVEGPVSTGAETVKVTLKDAPGGAAVLVKSFASDATDFTYDSGRPHGYNGNVKNGDNELALTFTSGGLLDGYLVAFLLLDGSVVAQSEPVAIQYVPAAPTVEISPNDNMFTAGDMYVRYSWSVDAQTKDASYKLYQFQGDELDSNAGQVLASGSLVTSRYNHAGDGTLGVGGRLKAGSKIQLVVTADGVQGVSNVLTVGPSPDWAKVTPSIAFGQTAVKDDADAVKVLVDYPEGYEGLGDEFFCNVVVYLYPGTYTDDDFENQELDEKPSIAPVVAGINSKNGQTNGELTLKLSESYPLEAGYRLMAKVRLPRAEQSAADDSEADYLSMSIPVVSADATVPGEALYVYNLDADTAKGERLRAIAAVLGLPVHDLSAAQLPLQVGAVAGFDGYDEVDSSYEGSSPSVEYMLMNVSEASLDRLLAAMGEDGVQVGAKGIITEYNKEWPLGRLIVDIAGEHETMEALVALQQLVKAAKALDRETYGSHERWGDLQEAINAAEELYQTEYATEDEEPEAASYRAAYDALEPLYLAVSGLARLDGRVRIDAAQRDDGTYTLAASVENAGVPSLDYVFTWNDAGKTQAPQLSGVAADKVGSRVVSVTADGAWGKLEGRILAPDAPAGMTASANPGSIAVSWDAQQAAFNQPAPTGYVAELFRDGVPVAKAETGQPSATFEGLVAGAYVVKAHAVNVAGRSDKVSSGEVTIDAAPSKPAESNEPRDTVPEATDEPAGPKAPSVPAASGTPAVQDASAPSGSPAAPSGSDVPASGENIEAAVDGAAVVVDIAEDGSAIITSGTVTGNTLAIGTVTTSSGATARVTAIAPRAFKGTTAEVVSIGDSVETIGAGAFSGSKSLKSVDVGDGVRAIGGKAFRGCSNLVDLSLGSSVETVGANAFSGCTSLSKVMVPASTTTIGTGAFKGCKNLRSMKLGKNVRSVGAKAFAGDKKLKTLKLSTSKLTKAACKNMLKGSSVKTIKLVGMSKAQKRKALENYKKWFPGKVAGKKLVIK